MPEIDGPGRRAAEEFRGAELAARYWQRYEEVAPTRRPQLDTLTQAAVDHLVRWLLGSMMGLDRWLKPEDALRIGFRMGWQMAQALAAGELDEADPDAKPVEFADLFRPTPPAGAH